jgi:hypothetical protein
MRRAARRVKAQVQHFEHYFDFFIVKTVIRNVGISDL